MSKHCTNSILHALDEMAYVNREIKPLRRPPRASRNRRIYLVGPFPPPIHGAALIISAVRDRLVEKGMHLIVVDLSAPRLGHSWGSRIKRATKVWRGFCRISFSRPQRGEVLYISVSGGLGKVYELLFALLARLLGLRIFLRHCSYAYLDRASRLAKWLINLAGPETTHIALSDLMAARLKKAYPNCHRVISLSNAMFVEQPMPTLVRYRNSIGTIGFLSNISEEKGIFDFLQVASRLESQGWNLIAKLAGPFDDPITERRVRKYMNSVQSVEYVGPKYNEEKSIFFDQVDVLLFPTRYANEATPVTIYEALAHGIPVIAYGRGSIAELVPARCGLVVDRNEDFSEFAVQQLEAWKASPDAFKEASREARLQFERLYQQSRSQWAELCAELSGDAK